MPLSLVKYSDVKFQITNLLDVNTVCYSFSSNYLLIISQEASKYESFGSLMHPTLRRGPWSPWLDPIMGCPAVPETQLTPQSTGYKK